MRMRGRPGEQREGTRRGTPRSFRRLPWIGAAVLALVVGVTLFAADGSPPTRMAGAGMVPAPTPLPLPRDGATSRAAEIAVEEARLAALRDVRLGLEQEIAALRAEVAAAQRALPALKTTPGEPAGPASAQLTRLVPPAPTVAPPPAEPVLRPPAEPALRIVLHHRAGTSQGAADDVAGRLREAGIEVQATRTAPFVPSTPVVRFFHDEDQAAAARIAGRLGRGWAIQDFRAYQPQPSPQTIEVWIPGG